LPFIACQDKLVSQQTFQIVRCQACQLLFTNPRPTAETIGTYYKSDAYISHDDTQTGLIDTVYRAVRTYTLNQKEKLIRSLNEGRRGAMLDYGCGTGTFLTQCQSVGWDIVGFEPDPDARRLAEQRTGQAILKDLKAVAAQPPLDVSTCFQVRCARTGRWSLPYPIRHRQMQRNTARFGPLMTYPGICTTSHPMC
jgi:SAM-dependent methyltransferase